MSATLEEMLISLKQQLEQQTQADVKIIELLTKRIEANQNLREALGSISSIREHIAVTPKLDTA